MGSDEKQEVVLSKEVIGSGDVESQRLVPVTESIRYRKRAQSAEKKSEQLVEELAVARSQISEMTEKLNELQLEQQLICKLSTAGAVDLETAMLIAKTRVQAGEQSDLDGVVEQLKKEKKHLFGQHANSAMTKRTAVVKDKVANNKTVLESAAKRAAMSGNRVDLQEYLRLRRSFV